MQLKERQLFNATLNKDFHSQNEMRTKLMNTEHYIDLIVQFIIKEGRK